MRVKVKICGIRTLEAAKAAISAGADFLGFNFVPSSPRYITPEHSFEIISHLPKNVKIVGVFANDKKEIIIDLIKKLQLDFVQLHGDENPKKCNFTHLAGVIKAFRLDPKFNDREFIDMVSVYDVDYIMVDRKINGEMLDFYRVQRVARAYRIFLAGGLTSENVKDTIRIVRPYAVDVASSVETNGKEDLEKIKIFIRNAKG